MDKEFGTEDTKQLRKDIVEVAKVVVYIYPDVSDIFG